MSRRNSSKKCSTVLKKIHSLPESRSKGIFLCYVLDKYLSLGQSTTLLKARVVKELSLRGF